jgi:hypothetical protein
VPEIVSVTEKSPSKAANQQQLTFYVTQGKLL